MADETTPRLGLPVYTSGSSAHPTRQDFNERMELLDEQVVVKREGAMADRPLPGDLPAGVVWEQTDAPYDLWWNTGQEWLQFARIGHGGAGRGLSIGASGAEGTSNRAARADHTHPLPMASASQDGALSAADKAMLNTASSNATGNSVARRNGSGQMSVASPTSAGHAANRTYVDTRLSDLAADAFISHPNIPVGHDINRTTTVGMHYIPVAASPTVINRPPDAPDSGATLLVYNAGTGGIYHQEWIVGTGSQRNRRWWRTRHAVSWVDWEEVEVKGHTHDASDIDSGELYWARLPLATRTQRGALSHTHHQNLEDATYENVDGTLVRRSNIGNFHISPGTQETHAAQRGWVEDQIDSAVEGLTQQRERITSGDLNDYTTAGVWSVWTSDFDQVSNLPGASSTIILEVTPAPSSLVRQDATNAFSGNRWWRSRTSSTWTDWQQVATV